MKKTILIVSALLMVFSGVAAVSAYEGHLINIKAHVENAIGVETYELDYGTVFPQETPEKNLAFGLSESFVDDEQIRVSGLTYDLYYELKFLAGHEGAGPPYETDYFQPLNPFLVLSDGDPDDGNDTFETQPVAVPGVGQAVLVGSGELHKNIPQPGGGPQGDLVDVIRIKFYAPVFEGYYNDITETYDYMLYAGEFELVNEWIGGNAFQQLVPHADLGIDLKIQITGFDPHIPD